MKTTSPAPSARFAPAIRPSPPATPSSSTAPSPRVVPALSHPLTPPPGARVRR